MKRLSFAVLGCVAFTAAARADEPPPYEGDPNWSMRALAGYSKTGGNTDNSAGNALFHVAHVMGDWKLLFGLEGLYGTTRGETTAQAWDVRLQGNYNITPKLYWYTGARYDDDAFSGFKYQTAVKTGVGYHFYDTDATKFTVQGGVGYVWLQKEFLVKDAVGGVTERLNYDPNTGIPYEQEHNVAFDAALVFEHSFDQYTKLLAGASVLASSANTLTTASIALQVKMSNRLALAAGYQLSNNSDPPAGSGHRDTLTTLSLVYDTKNPNLATE